MKIDKTEIAFVIVAGVLSLGLVVGPAHASPRPAAPQNQQNPQSAEQQDDGPDPRYSWAPSPEFPKIIRHHRKPG